MEPRKRIGLGEAGVSAGAAVLVAALSAVFGLFGPIGALGRLPPGERERIVVAAVALIVTTTSLVFLAYKVARLFAPLPLLSRYRQHPRATDLQNLLNDEKLLNATTGLTLADLERKVQAAHDALGNPQATQQAVDIAKTVLDGQAKILEYAGRWEREDIWDDSRAGVLISVMLAAAGAVAFAVSVSPPSQALVTGPTPVTVQLNPTGWAKLSCTPAATPSPLGGVAVDGRLSEPTVILDASGPCTPQRFTVEDGLGLAIPRTSPPPSPSSLPAATPSRGAGSPTGPGTPTSPSRSP